MDFPAHQWACLQREWRNTMADSEIPEAVDAVAAPAAASDKTLAEKNAALADWHAANSSAETHTLEQKQDLLKLMTDLFGEGDGAVAELKAEVETKA
jgi:hypothetical protein